MHVEMSFLVWEGLFRSSWHVSLRSMYIFQRQNVLSWWVYLVLVLLVYLLLLIWRKNSIIGYILIILVLSLMYLLIINFLKFTTIIIILKEERWDITSNLKALSLMDL